MVLHLYFTARCRKGFSFRFDRVPRLSDVLALSFCLSVGFPCTFGVFYVGLLPLRSVHRLSCRFGIGNGLTSRLLPEQTSRHSSERSVSVSVTVSGSVPVLVPVSADLTVLIASILLAFLKGLIRVLFDNIYVNKK